MKKIIIRTEKCALYTFPYAQISAISELLARYSIVIHESAKIGDCLTIGAGTTIGKNAQIGNFVQIGKDCEISIDCTIECGTIISDHVTLNRDVKIMRNCHLYESANIGSGSTLPPYTIIGENAKIPKNSTPQFGIFSMVVDEQITAFSNGIICIGDETKHLNDWVFDDCKALYEIGERSGFRLEQNQIDAIINFFDSIYTLVS